MAILEGRTLAAELKEKQKERVDRLISRGIKPTLAITSTKDDAIIDTYVRLKKLYGDDIGVEVQIHRPHQTKLPELIKELNADKMVQGIIIQLPLANPSETDRMVNFIDPSKDVDGLGEKAEFEPATPLAIFWLLEFHKIDLKNKTILLIGRGKLVGAPLEKMLRKRDLKVIVIDKPTPELSRLAGESDVIISATGSPGILKSEMVHDGTAIVDAGLASEKGKLLGDADSELYNRDNISITPVRGGVGPLTICALMNNLIQAAEQQL